MKSNKTLGENIVVLDISTNYIYDSHCILDYQFILNCFRSNKKISSLVDAKSDIIENLHFHRLHFCYHNNRCFDIII